MFVANEALMLEVGNKIASNLSKGLIIFLTGDLGSGKTTLVRGILNALGHKGAVKSPTFAIVEEYPQLKIPIYHFDLYRLEDPIELEYMGIREYFNNESAVILEWPEKGKGVLPLADLCIDIKILNSGRKLEFISNTDNGKKLLCFLGS